MGIASANATMDALCQTIATGMQQCAELTRRPKEVQIHDDDDIVRIRRRVPIGPISIDVSLMACKDNRLMTAQKAILATIGHDENISFCTHILRRDSDVVVNWNNTGLMDAIHDILRGNMQHLVIDVTVHFHRLWKEVYETNPKVKARMRTAFDAVCESFCIMTNKSGVDISVCVSMPYSDDCELLHEVEF